MTTKERIISVLVALLLSAIAWVGMLWFGTKLVKHAWFG